MAPRTLTLLTVLTCLSIVHSSRINLDNVRFRGVHERAVSDDNETAAPKQSAIRKSAKIQFTDSLKNGEEEEKAEKVVDDDEFVKERLGGRRLSGADLAGETTKAPLTEQDILQKKLNEKEIPVAEHIFGSDIRLTYDTGRKPIYFGDKFRLTTKQQLWVKSLIDKDLPCIKDNTHCGAEQMVVRQEIRTLSDDMRKRVLDAMLRMRTDPPIDGLNKFDIFTFIHGVNVAISAGRGPGFLGFHRMITRLYESALREIDSGIALPMWDTTLDAEMPDPRDSTIWHDELFGNNNGVVVTGPFAYYEAPQINKNPIKSKFVWREAGANKTLEIIAQRDIDWLFNHTFYDLDHCVNPFFELAHGNQHVWVGSYKNPGKTTATIDPIFFCYHSFIDWIFEDFRQLTQSRKARETEYAPIQGPYCSRPWYEQDVDNPMLPFYPITNGDGLSNAFTDWMYEYIPSPHRCEKNLDCKSRYLFCNLNNNRCMSRIMMGGNCTGMENIPDACFRSHCLEQVCTIRHRPWVGEVDAPEPIKTQEWGVAWPYVWVKVFVWQKQTKQANRPISVVAEGDNYPGMAVSELPYEKEEDLKGGFVLVKVKRPDSQSIAKLRAYDSFGRVCAAHCPAFADRGYHPCPGIVTLTQQSAINKIAALQDRGIESDDPLHVNTPYVVGDDRPAIVFMCEYAEPYDFDTVVLDFDEIQRKYKK